MSDSDRTWMTVPERRQSNARRIDILDIEVAWLKASLTELAELYVALNERFQCSASDSPDSGSAACAASAEASANYTTTTGAFVARRAARRAG